jgi:hypothetical protein
MILHRRLTLCPAYFSVRVGEIFFDGGTFPTARSSWFQFWPSALLFRGMAPCSERGDDCCQLRFQVIYWVHIFVIHPVPCPLVDWRSVSQLPHIQMGPTPDGASYCPLSP